MSRHERALTITKFLEWQIALEEDGRARTLRDLAEALRLRGDGDIAEFLDRESSRVLATCKAHRAVAEDHVRAGCDYCPEVPDDCPTLRALSNIYADHTDYDPAWKAAV